MGPLRVKYMGSKRSMLRNGLGEVISHVAPTSKGFVDLFTGSGAVACHVAERYDVAVEAIDLQAFATALADGVVGRNAPEDGRVWFDSWFASAEAALAQSQCGAELVRIESQLDLTDLAKKVSEARHIAAESEFSFCRAYGGYYFSPLQAALFGALRENLPAEAGQKKIALAALISTASQCAASPGHTAQPFQPTETAGKYLLEAWGRSVKDILSARAEEIAKRYAIRVGGARVADANQVATQLEEGWVAFVDPPYSSVHYSRFYHVLETLCRGGSGEVSGAGRYPPQSERPSSKFSIQTLAYAAFDDLFTQIASAGAKAIVTFPDKGASNGITGDILREIAADKFEIVEEKVSSRFSTMGGNSNHRAARQDAVELILSLCPR